MKTFKSLMSEGSKEEYQKFFNGKLAKWKIKSPAELSDEDKKSFLMKLTKSGKVITRRLKDWLKSLSKEMVQDVGVLVVMDAELKGKYRRRRL